jgi:hypothetical protein
MARATAHRALGLSRGLGGAPEDALHVERPAANGCARARPGKGDFFTRRRERRTDGTVRLATGERDVVHLRIGQDFRPVTTEDQ